MWTIEFQYLQTEGLASESRLKNDISNLDLFLHTSESGFTHILREDADFSFELFSDKIHDVAAELVPEPSGIVTMPLNFFLLITRHCVIF